MEFTDVERAILRIVQKDLPDTLTPYADIANAVGTSEEVVLELLSRLKESGAIRRFGASLKHQKTEWTHNVMVAWMISPDDVDTAGDAAWLFNNCATGTEITIYNDEWVMGPLDRPAIEWAIPMNQNYDPTDPAIQNG